MRGAGSRLFCLALPPASRILYPSTMGYRTLQDCIDDLERHRHLVHIDAEVDARLEAGRDSTPRVRGWRAGAAVHAREGLPLPDGRATCSARWTARGSCFAISLERVRRLIELKIDPTAGFRRPLRYVGSPLSAACDAAQVCSPRGRNSQRNDDLAIAAAGELAGRRRRVHHVAAGVHRRRDATRLAALEPGHVPRAAFRRPIRARPRNRPALSNPSLDRRASRGRDSCGQAVSRERLRRRPAGDDARRRDAAAGRHERADVRRGARRPPHPHASPRGRLADPRRHRLLHLRHRRAQQAAARRAVRRSPGLLQPAARLPGAARRARVSSRRRDLAVHGRRPAAAGGHDLRPADPRADRAGDSDGAPRRAWAYTRSTRPAYTRCCWPSAASATGRSPNRTGRRNCSRRPTRSSARGSCRSRSSC